MKTRHSKGALSPDPLDDDHRDLTGVLRSRFHGAASIHGIRFQLVYSLLRAFELYGPEAPTCVRLEGLEDVDLLGLTCGDVLVQVKSSSNPWVISSLEGPLRSFLAVLRVHPEARFSLVLGGDLGPELRDWVRPAGVPVETIAKLEKKVRKVVRRIGATTEETTLLLDATQILNVDEQDAWQRLRRAVSDNFGLGSDSLSIYVPVLVAQFLDWAQERKQIAKADLDRVRARIGEAASLEHNYEAFGRGLVSRVNWHPTHRVEDFFDGKAVRPEHIAAGVDVPRKRWLDRIHQVLEKTKICVIRSASGQGKSTLLYRYAKEYGVSHETYLVQVIQTQEQVHLLREFIRFRASLGSPLLILMDNADWRLQYWPQVAEECATLSLRVLVTTRQEDWYRFAETTRTDYEIIEPTLELEEAREILLAFEDRGRLHSSIDSADYAWERIGEPRLLLEYVYFLTHGTMLVDRLEAQLRSFTRQGDDPAKQTVLRMVSVAASLDTPLQTTALVKAINWREDPQQILKSLDGEYVVVTTETVAGLHWVRSEHLARLLHDQFRRVGETVVECLDAVPEAALPVFAANAITKADLDIPKFLRDLSIRAASSGPRYLLSLIDGVFEGGERNYAKANRQLFDHCRSQFGSSTSLLLSAATMPTDLRMNLAECIGDLLGEKGKVFRDIQGIASHFSDGPRGVELCRQLLEESSDRIRLVAGPEGYGVNGVLLDWCAFCSKPLPAWTAQKDNLLTSPMWREASVADVCSWAQGLFRYDPESFDSWLFSFERDLLAYLRFHTDSLQLHRDDQDMVVRFLPSNDDRSGNDQAVERLRVIRAVFPRAKRYRSEPIRFNFLGRDLEHDDARKAIPPENLPAGIDVQRNVVWRKVVESHLVPDSYYRYLGTWHEIRKRALSFSVELISFIRSQLSGHKPHFPRLNSAVQQFAAVLGEQPDPPQRGQEPLHPEIKKAQGRWASSFQNFFVQVCDRLRGEIEPRSGTLIVVNSVEAFTHLQTWHRCLGRLFISIPDYHLSTELVKEELRVYARLDESLYAWVVDPPKVNVNNLRSYVRARRLSDERRRVAELRSAIEPLRARGVDVTVANQMPVIDLLRYAVLVTNARRPSEVDGCVDATVAAVLSVRHVADFFCFVRAIDGRRLNVAQRLSADRLAGLEEGREIPIEVLGPYELPPEVEQVLPKMDQVTDPLFQLPPKAVNLRASLDYLAFVEDCMSALRKSDHIFDRELEKRHRDQMKTDANKIRMKAGEDLSLLKQVRLDGADSPAYDLLSRFLSRVADGEGAEACLGSAFQLPELYSAAQQILDSHFLDGAVGRTS